jgi:hypothetical protein
MNSDLPATGPLHVAGRFLTPVDAQVFAHRLIEEGVAAQVMDSDTIYVNGTSVAFGGVRVMVPESQLQEAERISAALDAGEYAIDENYDVGK